MEARRAEHLGSDSILKVDIDGIGSLTVRAPGEVTKSHGDRIRLAQAGKNHRFNAEGLAL